MSRAAKKNRKAIIELSDDELEGPIIQSSSEDDFKADESSSESELDTESMSSSVVSSEVEPSPVKKNTKKGAKGSLSKRNKKSDIKIERVEDKNNVSKRKHSIEDEKEVKKKKVDDSDNKKSSSKSDNAPRAEELPFAAEYAKTSRATCKHCGSKIEKNELKLCTRFPSPFFDGYQEQGYVVSFFFCIFFLIFI